jgi:hypothetical protein
MQLLYFLILAVLFLIMIILGVKTDMLRNTVINMANFNAMANKRNTSKPPKASFSLGRTQLAFWTVIVIGSFVYLLIQCSPKGGIEVPAMDSINLFLLGIAAGTAVVAKVIDNSQQNSADNTTVSQQDIPSKGFFTDIISDETGVSVHRLQNVIWTIVIAGIYIAYVSTKFAIPDKSVISDTMLGLMGISSAAYLGVKTTENTTPVPQPPPADPMPAPTPVQPPIAPAVPVQPAPVAPAPPPIAPGPPPAG